MTSKKAEDILNKWLNKALLGLILLNLFTYFISNFWSKLSMIITIAFLTMVCVIKFSNVGEKLNKYKWVKKLKFMLEMKEIQSKAENITHAMTLVGKYLHDLPIKSNEDEVTSFNDVLNSYGERWPFMQPISKTREKLVSVRGKKVECVSSYSYLDLCRDERVQEAGIEAARAYSSGNHGPRMLCGNLEILEQLEQKIAKFYKKEAALVFSSGYLACMSVISGVARKGDMLLMDKLCHASLRSGAKLSGAKIVNFRHNDFKDAEKMIKANKYKRIFMIIEGVYSMDGDVGDLEEARKLCDKYNAVLILDEAHSLGVIGKTGRGTEEVYEYKFKADIICGTFTKSIASVGGFITCNQRLRDFYTFNATGVVFSAPLSAYHAGAALKAFEIIDSEPQIVTKCQENSEYFRKKFVEKGFNIGNSTTCVIPVIFRDTKQCFQLHGWMLDRGYFTSLVMAPACSITAPRFRITCSSAMTKQQMDDCVKIFCEAQMAIKENNEMRELLEGM
jgi:7-keto-8-aminopelargonate synthetase-like enzyme